MARTSLRVGVACAAAAVACVGAGASGLSGCGGGSSHAKISARSSTTGERAEAEPNDTTATATPFTLSQVATGTISASTATADVDRWSFQANAGTLLDLEVFALRRDYAAWAASDAAPRLELRAPSGAIVGQLDYHYGFGAVPLDPAFRKLYLPESGTYTLSVIPMRSDTTDGGDGAYLFTSAASLPTRVVTSAGTGPATAVDLGATDQTVVGFYDPSGGSHVYQVSLGAGEVLRVEIFASRNVSGDSAAQASSWDPEVDVLDTTAVTVLEGDDAATLDGDLRFAAPVAGAYFLEVRSRRPTRRTTRRARSCLRRRAPA